MYNKYVDDIVNAIIECVNVAKLDPEITTIKFDYDLMSYLLKDKVETELKSMGYNFISIARLDKNGYLLVEIV